MENKKYSGQVEKCREHFKDHTGTTKMFVKGGTISPIFPSHSCAKSETIIREIEKLEIGESTYNTNRTLITRVF